MTAIDQQSDPGHANSSTLVRCPAKLDGGRPVWLKPGMVSVCCLLSPSYFSSLALSTSPAPSALSMHLLF